MATGRDDEGRERPTLRVASRAVRRGRKLRASVLPPAPGGLDEGPAPDELDAAATQRAPDDDADTERAADSEAGKTARAEDSLPADAEAPLDEGDRAETQRAAESDAVADSASTFATRPARSSEEPWDEEPIPSRNVDRASADDPSIRVRESSLPDVPPSSKLAPSIRVRESSLPDGFDEDELSQSARFSRPLAPRLSFAGRRNDRPSMAKVTSEPAPPASDRAVAAPAPANLPAAEPSVLAEVPVPGRADVADGIFSEDTMESSAPQFDDARNSDAEATRVSEASASPLPSRQVSPDGDGSESEELHFEPGASSGSDRRGYLIGFGAVALGALLWFSRSPVPEPPVAREPAPTAAVTSSPAARASSAPQTATPTGTATADVVEPADSATAAPAASASSAFEDPDAAPGSEFDVIRKEFIALHNGHKLKESEEIARKLIALRPNDATGYRCLGAALQDQGRMKEAKATYSECVTRATKGDVSECAQLGGTLKRAP